MKNTDVNKINVEACNSKGSILLKTEADLLSNEGMSLVMKGCRGSL